MATSKVNEISNEKLQAYIDKAKVGLAGYGEGGVFKRNRYQGIDDATDIIKNRKHPITNPKIHDLRHMSHGEAYNHTQVSDHIKDGDILHVKGGAGLMYKAWPVMVKGESDAFHHIKDGANWDSFSHGRYKKAAELAMRLKDDEDNHHVEESVMEEFNPDKVAFYEMLDDVMNKNILGFQEKFNEVLVGRLSDAVENFKSNLTNHVFNGETREITPAVLEKYMKKNRDDDDYRGKDKKRDQERNNKRKEKAAARNVDERRHFDYEDEDDDRRKDKERTKERKEKRKEKNAIHASIHKEDTTGIEDEGTLLGREEGLNLAQEDHWIQGAIKHPGALHRELGVPAGKKIPAKKLKAAEHSSNPLERKRADLAATLKHMHH